MDPNQLLNPASGRAVALSVRTHAAIEFVKAGITTDGYLPEDSDEADGIVAKAFLLADAVVRQIDDTKN